MTNRPSAQALNRCVEQALLRKATGYTYTQQETYKLKRTEYAENGKKISETETIETVGVEKHVLPEFSAIALWLKARSPRRWGEATESLPQTVVHIIDDIPSTGTSAAPPAAPAAAAEPQPVP